MMKIVIVLIAFLLSLMGVWTLGGTGSEHVAFSQPRTLMADAPPQNDEGTPGHRR